MFNIRIPISIDFICVLRHEYHPYSDSILLMESMSFRLLSSLILTSLGNLSAKPDSYVGLFCISSKATSNTTSGLTFIIVPDSDSIKSDNIVVSSLSCSSEIPVPTRPTSRSWPLTSSTHASMNEPIRFFLLPSPHCALVTTKSRVSIMGFNSVSYTHLRAHETRHDLVCRL